MENIFPWRCVVCAARTRSNTAVCHACKPLLPYCKNSCANCGAQIANEGSNHLICGKCQQQLPFYDYLKTAFWYESPIDNLIVDYKYNNQWKAIEALLDLTYESFSKYCQNKLIVPVPSHSSRIRSRGFNVVYEFLRLMRQRITFEYSEHLIDRTINTKAQAGLKKEYRRKNLNNAFTVRENVVQKKILVVDDVVTTGTTVNEISRCFKMAGAQQVGVWAMARTK